MSNLFIFGKGGHASVINELALLNNYNNIKFIDDYSDLDEKKLSIEDSIIIAIGDNTIRKEKSILYFQNINKTLIHPSSNISNSSTIGNGTVICTNTVINTDSKICDNVIINSSAVIEHHCYIGNYAHIAPNVTLCGNVKIEEGVLIGAGSVILPGIKIGKWAIVGAGSVVVKDVDDYQTVYGNPAKNKK